MTVNRNDPTRAGGSDGGGEEREAVLSPREVAMAQIEARVDAGRQEQMQTEEAPVMTTEEAVVVDDPSRFKIRVKVGEHEQEKTVTEVLAELSTARGRLKAQGQKEKELEARERLLAEKETQLQAQLSGLPSSLEDADDNELKTVVAALLDGDTDLAQKALREVINKGRQPATPEIDRAQLAAEVKETLAGETIWENFVRENPEFRTDLDAEGNEVRSDQRQYGDFLYVNKFAAAVDAGEISYQAALNSVASAVKKAFSASPTPDVPETGKTAREEKLERKRAIDNLAVAAGARAPVDAPEPATAPSDVIKEMRKARGLPV